MDKLNDLFNEVKLRLKNPFISSFIISWLITNWRVIIGMFKYTNDELENHGYKDYISFVSNEARWSNFLIIPLCWALFYTLIFPWLNGLFIIAQSSAKVWSNKKNDKIMETFGVPLSRFSKLKKEYKDLSKEYKEMIEEDGENLVERNKAEAQLIVLNGEITQKDSDIKTKNEKITNLNDIISKCEQMNSVSLINGVWNLSTERKELISEEESYLDNEKIKLRIIIQNNNINIDRNGTEPLWGHVIGFSHNIFRKSVQLTLELKRLHSVILVPMTMEFLSHQVLDVEYDADGNIVFMSGRNQNNILFEFSKFTVTSTVISTT